MTKQDLKMALRVLLFILIAISSVLAIIYICTFLFRERRPMEEVKETRYKNCIKFANVHESVFCKNYLE